MKSSISSIMMGSNEDVSKTTSTKIATRVHKRKNKLTLPEDEKMSIDRDASSEAHDPYDDDDDDDDNEQTVKPSASRRRNATTASTRRQTTVTSGVRASGSTMTKKRGTPLPDKVKVL